VQEHQGGTLPLGLVPELAAGDLDVTGGRGASPGLGRQEQEQNAGQQRGAWQRGF
jgi:hypothetical protein